MGINISVPVQLSRPCHHSCISVLYVAENKKPAPISQPASGEMSVAIMCNFYPSTFSGVV